MDHAHHEASSLRTGFIIFLLLLIIAVQAGLAYVLIGDRGQPDWDYRPVRDVPGESPYAVYEYLPFPQHVKGNAVDYPPLDQNWTPQLNDDWDRSFFPEPKPNAVGD